jgi:hypothetical protein
MACAGFGRLEAVASLARPSNPLKRQVSAVEEGWMTHDRQSQETADGEWTPVFPAGTLRAQGQSSAAAFACDGHDRHDLSMPMRRAAAGGAAGATLIAVALLFHVYGRGLGAGIGLLLVPLCAWLFAQWVDGPVLYYRRWGRMRRLPLNRVTGVSAAKVRGGRLALLLSASGVSRPIRVSVRTRGYEMSTAARAHLHGWLSAPQVQWTVQAAALLDDEKQAALGTRGRRRPFARVLAGALLLAAVGAGAWTVYVHRQDLAIPGAPGYSTFTGPHGEPLAVGRPWGRACQPVRFAVEEHVPRWVYDQVAQVVSEARSDGIDVAVENRQFFWNPASLYYVGGQSPASTVRVGIFSSEQAPPQLPSGAPEHVAFDWDAVPDPDGHHEDLTQVQGMLWMRTLAGDAQAVRRSVRQLIAVTQGILRTSRQDSGIAQATSVDRFSVPDLAAMRRMSGCSG